MIFVGTSTWVVTKAPGSGGRIITRRSAGKSRKRLALHAPRSVVVVVSFHGPQMGIHFGYPGTLCAVERGICQCRNLRPRFQGD